MLPKFWKSAPAQDRRQNRSWIMVRESQLWRSVRISQFLRTKFVGNQALDVVTGEFEKVELESEAFDLVFAATAFHWLDSAIRLYKAHSLLRPSGTLGILTTVQVRSIVDRGFFE